MDKFDDVQLSDDEDVDNNEDGGKVMLVFPVMACITENSLFKLSKKIQYPLSLQ